ncbi:MAG: cell division protein FtsA [Candidatus Coatesbacteria bacterium]|nr:MAG: cell division protein FtsA [Candidatus Coatesbacteria bacterium]
MNEKYNIVAGLDVGTTKVCCVVAKQDAGPAAEVLGTGLAPSLGSKRGMVVNIESTVQSVVEAVREAEQMSGVEVGEVNVGIAGGHIKSMNSRGIVAISSPDREITKKDIDRCIEQAKAIALPVDREVLHVLPKEFAVDDQRGIKDPRGMVATRLEAEVHIVTGAITSAQNLVRSVNRAGLKVNRLVLEPLASARAVLTPDEMELGVALVDMGGGTTDMAIFHEGSVRHTSVLAVGGDQVTRDLAVGLRTPRLAAEQIKQKYAVALTSLVAEDGVVEVADVGGRRARMIDRSYIAEIAQARLEEIITLVKREIGQSGYADLLAAGVVLTGGCANMEGLAELAEEIFNTPTRIGLPLGVTGLSESVADPLFATGVGLIQYQRPAEGRFQDGPDSEAIIFHKIFSQMKSWMESIF